MPDINQRLVIYRRLSTVLIEDDIADLEQELIDRYGALPLPVEHLMELARLKSVLRRYLILAVDYAAVSSSLPFTRKQQARSIRFWRSFPGTGSGSASPLTSSLSHDTGVPGDWRFSQRLKTS